MEEKPNLNYVNTLSDGDESIRQKLITILKEEYPQEQESYYKASLSLNFIEMAECVHKLSHKIGFLGLEEDHFKAQLFEENLRNGSVQNQIDFEKCLDKIENFISKL